MGNNVNLLITSRPLISLEPFSLSDLNTLDIQATPDDLREYINAQICSSRLSWHVKELPKLQEEIHKKIIGAVDGMYVVLNNCQKATEKNFNQVPSCQASC
jgi:hypothetical protein